MNSVEQGGELACPPATSDDEFCCCALAVEMEPVVWIGLPSEDCARCGCTCGGGIEACSIDAAAWFSGWFSECG